MATSWVQRSCDFYAARVKVYTHEWQIHRGGERKRKNERERERDKETALDTLDSVYIYTHTHIHVYTRCVARVRRAEEVEEEDRRDLTHPGLCALA